MKPKFKLGIVIPTYNSARYLKDSVMSIATQEVDPNHKIHLHIQDGGSEDETTKILHDFTKFDWRENFLYTYSSETDLNMYDGLNKGFSKIDSEVMTYLGSDDILYPLSFRTAISFLEQHPSFHWITGVTQIIGESGILLSGQGYESSHWKPQGFPNSLLRDGLFDGKHNPFVMQEGTFWTRQIWEETEKKFDEDLKLAGDYDLWIKFSQNNELIQLATSLAAHRKRAGQLSENLTEYYSEVEKILSKVKRHYKCRGGKEFSKFGLIGFWNEGNKTWTISTTAGEKFWKRQLDFVISSKTAYFEGPYPEKGIDEKFFWVGRPVEISILKEAIQFSTLRTIRIRILNNLEENRAKIHYGGRDMSFSLESSSDVQEVSIGTIPHFRHLIIDSEKSVKESSMGRSLGFKILSIELTD
jgi:glycosyltransferase involved in cell wall biosynthesis